MTAVLVSATLVFVAPPPPAQAADAASTVPPMIDNPATGVTAAPLPTAQINGIAWDQVIVGNTVYVGGEFTSARPAGAAAGTSESPRQNLMSYNLTTGVMTSWAPNVNGRIRVMAASKDGSRIYIAGSFTTVNGQARYRIAAFNTSDGSLVPGFAPVVGADVFGIAVGTNAVYLGGWFASINGVERVRLGAVSTATGATLAWAPTADNLVDTLGLTSAEDRVIIGGSFATVNGATAKSIASVDATNGNLYPFAANQVVDNSAMNPSQPGYGAAVTAIRMVNDKVYFTGWSYFMGNFEGMIKADAYTGQIENLMECRGDTYDAVPFKGLIYTVSHHHRCDAIGGFPEQATRTWQHADAVTEEVTGQVQHTFPGQPSGSYVHWLPNWQPGPAGSGSNAQQAGWTTEAAGDYLAIGGEFLRVNGIAQQGLVRFGTRNVPGALTSTPAAPGSEMVPRLLNISETSTRVSVKSQWDRDNRTLTTNVFRLDRGTTVPVHTFTGESTWWNRPMLSWVDTGLTPGQTYTYRIQFVDPDGNRRTSSEVSIVAGTNVPPSSAYSEQVFADAPTNYWRLGDAAGATTAVDWAGGNDLALTSGITMGQEGAVIGSADTAAAFSGANGVSGSSSTSLDTAPDTFSQELWFKTTTTSGGKLIGFGSAATGNSSSYDRHVYMSNTGRLSFGVYPGATRTVTSSKSYNDGAWHHVVTSLSPAGMVLWVDGMKIGVDAGTTSGQPFVGYWRIGGDSTGSWANAGSSNYFNGTIDDVAIYPVALTRDQIRDHYTKSGRTVNVPPTPADPYGASVVTDDPTLYWRLNETGGTTAQDANGNGVDGTYYNGVVQGVASDVVPSDPAARFDGTNDLVSSNTSFINPTVFSIEAWFNTTTTTGGKIIGFGRSATGNSQSYDRHIYLTNNGRLNFGAYNGSTVVITSPNSYNNGAWHHVVGTLGPNGMQLFVDGVLVGTHQNTAAENYTGYWRVGGDNTWSGNRYFNGLIDEFAVYPRVLTGARVMAHYKASAAAVNAAPTAAINGTCTVTGACTLTADATDPDGTIASLSWDFGDGSPVSTDASVTHTYAAVGTYTITLTATDDLGAVTSVTRTVTVKAAQPVPTDPYGQLVSQDNPYLYWRLGEADGATAYDYSREVRDGTYYGGAVLNQDSTVVAGNKAVNLPGDAAVASQDKFTNPTTFSAEAWFNTTAAGARIIGFGNTQSGRSNNYDRHVYLDGSGRVVFGVWNGGAHTITTPGAFNNGAWHHVVATMGASGMALYVDGALVGTNPHVGVDAYDGYWRLGADNIWDGGGQVNGLVDEAAVYGHVLSAAAVKAHYRASGVFVNLAPSATFSLAKSGLSVTADASAASDPDGTIAGYAWAFGDGATSTAVAPSHTYAGPGTYALTLTVTDELGSATTATRSVTVRQPAPVTDEYGQAVGADDPLLYWRLDETSGTTARDATAHTYDGTYSGGSRGAASPVTSTGRSAAFTGDTFAAANEPFTNPTTFSVEAWFRTAQTGQRIIGFGDSASGRSANYDRHVFVNDAGQLVFGTYSGGFHTVQTSTSYNDNAWHHVVATLGGSGMALYVDGVLQASNADTVAQPYDGYWRIGADNLWSGSGDFNGQIDEAAVYATALGADRVAAHFAASLASNAAPVADFTADCTGASCALVATASDPDGTVASYDWDLGDGSPRQASATVNHVYAAAGTYPVTLVVTDNRGTSTTVSRDVVVVIPNTPPTALIATPVVSDLTVEVDGSGSTDADGTVTAQSWDFGDGSAVVDGATATHTYSAGGTYTVTLTVTDDDGATATRTVEVTVAPPNALPTAAIAPVTPAGLSVGVDGSGSSDPDGAVVGYAWTFGDGATATGPTASHTYTGGGTYTISLTVTDNRGGTATTSRTVTVVAPNQAPTAVIGTPVTNGLGVSVDGSASSDPENTALGYAWDFGDGSTATGATAQHTYAAGGTFTITLVVTDAGGASNAATRTVTVAPPNARPVAAIGTPAVSGLTVQVDGSASADSDGSVAGYAWSFGDGATATTPTATHTYAAGGTYTVKLVVTDNLGLASDEVSTTVTVVAPNQAPVPHISTPVVNGLGVSVDGSTSTDDGTITGYAWTFGDGGTAGTATATHTYAAAGTYTVTLTVTDNAGVTASTSTSVTVAATNQKPTAVFPAPTTDLNVVHVNGSGSTDADGSIVGYAWNFGDGQTATTAVADHAYAAGGTYTVTLTVTDNSGATDTATRSVTVSAPPVTSLARDTFNRTGSRWGTADQGGAWTDSGATYFATDGALGQVTVARAGSGPSATLAGVSARDVTLVTDFALAAAPTGAPFAHSTMARINGTTYYVLNARVETNGGLRIYLSRVVSGAETQLRSVLLSSFGYTAGERIRVRFDLNGTGTTTLSGKAWRLSGAEPATPQVTITDTTASLQGAGQVGLKFYTGAATTSLPTRISVDNFQVVPYTGGGLQNQAPVARFDATAASWKVDVDASASTDDGSITAYAWDFGDGTTGSGRTASHTYAANGTYQVKLTVTDDRGVTTSLTKPVTVANAAPVAGFTATPAEFVLAVDASASTDDGTIAGYAWTFGDGATGSGRTASHTYAAAGTYDVTLTVTDTFGVATSLTKAVIVANAAPVAGFTSASADLKLDVDASSSTDDAGVTGYAWDFGDGATGSGKTATHTYAAAGTYTVTLTVTDARGLTGTTTRSVTVAANAAPTASFTVSANDLAVSVNAGASSDSDGSIAGYAWQFGDGGTASGVTATHTYAAAGTYTVTLTVTDNGGRTDATTRSVTVTAPVSPVVAADTFARTVASGWGSADTGGAWTSTSNAMLSVNGSRGLITIPAAGRGPVQRLTAVSERDVSMVTDFALDRVPAGGAYSHQVLARMDGTSTYYMLVARVNTNGSLQVYLSRVVAGAETVLRTQTLSTFNYAANERIRLRLDVTGTGTTSLSARFWRSGDPEPASPQLTVTDSTAALQGAGAVGIKAYTGASMTSVPLVVSVGGFRVEKA